MSYATNSSTSLCMNEAFVGEGLTAPSPINEESFNEVQIGVSPPAVYKGK